MSAIRDRLCADRRADLPIDPPAIGRSTRRSRRKWRWRVGGVLLFVDLRPSRPRVLARPCEPRRGARSDHVHATRAGEPPRRRRRSIHDALRDVSMSLSRTKKAARPKQADREQDDEESRRRPADRRLVAVRHLHLDLRHLEDRQQRVRVHLVMLVVDLVAEVLQHRRALLLEIESIRLVSSKQNGCRYAVIYISTPNKFLANHKKAQ